MNLCVEAWYRNTALRDVQRWWMDHLDALGLTPSGVSSDPWGIASLAGEPAYVAVTARRDGHVAAEVLSRGASREQMRGVALALTAISPAHVRPVEILVLEGTDPLAAGPLVCLHLDKNGILYCLRGMQHNSLFDERQLRVIHRSLFPQLERLLLAAAPRYTQQSWIANDFIWLDFHWTNPGFEVHPGSGADHPAFVRGIYLSTPD